METTNEYWIAIFSYGVQKKYEVPDGVGVMAMVNKYLKEQNKGEAKSDKLELLMLKMVSKETFDREICI